MLYQQVVQAPALVSALHQIPEAVITIEGTLPNKCYQATIYKYQQDYFLLQCRDVRDLLCTIALDQETSSETILNTIETTLENNCYLKLDPRWLYLDVKILLNDQIPDLIVKLYQITD